MFSWTYFTKGLGFTLEGFEMSIWYAWEVCETPQMTLKVGAIAEHDVRHLLVDWELE